MKRAAGRRNMRMLIEIKRTSLLIFAIHTALLAIPGFLTGTDWPQFMNDESRSGFSPEPGFSVGSLAWIYDTGNVVLSSLVVADGIVFAGAADGFLYALDAMTGNELWRYETSAWIESSPVVSGGLVFAGGMDRKIYALNTDDGSERWQFETSGWLQCALLSLDEKVYAGSMDHSLYAVDSESGGLSWHFETRGFISAAPSYCSTEELLIVASDDFNLYAINPDSGQEVWRYFAGGFIETAPICSAGKIFFIVSDNGEINDASIENKLIAIEASGGVVTWELDLDENDMVFSSMVLVDDLLVAATFSGAIFGVDVSTGTTVWRIKPDDFAFFSSLAATGEMVVAVDLEGKCFVLDPENGAIRQFLRAPDGTYASPAISDGLFFTADISGRIYALQIGKQQ